jgi:RND family efflux transporter MFP subunit
MKSCQFRTNLLLLALILGFAPVVTMAQPGSQAAPVSVEQARVDIFSASLWVSGTVISRNDSRIGAETAGRLTWVADVGTRIAFGEPIATIDDADLRLDLRDSEAQLESLKAQRRYQTANLDRLRRLANNNNASANDIDEAQSTLDMTDQEIRRAEVSIDQIERRIKQTRVVAPFAGVVVERLVQVGEFVSRGDQVARLVDTENREIRASAPLSIAPFLREGLEVSIEHREMESLSPVSRIIPVGDERSRMFEVRIAAENPSWVVGSPVRVALPNGDPRELLAIPRDALVLRGSEAFVLRVNQENTVEKIKVSTGIGLGSLIEVTGELSAGDRVVTRGAERLQPGQAVVINNG